MNKAFSKILVIGILVVVIAGGFFVWQKFGVEKEEVKAPEEFSKSFDDDDLLRKLFPNLEFKNGRAVSLEDSEYKGMGLSLFLDKKIEDYFISKKEKSLLLIVSLKGVPHAGGLYHSYLGLFDSKGNLLTPVSVFPKPNFRNLSGFPDYYDFLTDKAQFGGDIGEFNFYNCGGISHILFTSGGCPNGGCCSEKARLMRVENNNFKTVQEIDYSTDDYSLSYEIKIDLGDKSMRISKATGFPNPPDYLCDYKPYKELSWDNGVCKFK